jgi:hypothetical protein
MNDSGADLLQRGIDLLKGMASQPTGISRIMIEGTSIVTRGWVEYMKLNAEHAQRVCELGRTLSNDFFASLDTRGEACRPPGAAQGSVQELNELHLEGRPGDLCRSGFVLESRKSAPVEARVRMSRFLDESENHTVSIPLVVDPAQKTVAPGEKVRFTVEAGIPDATPVGTYHAMVWLDGFPELSMRVFVSVGEAVVEEKPVPAADRKVPQKTKKRRASKS